MRRLSIALGAALILSVSAGPAFAASGTYDSDDGPSCYWSGSGGNYTIDCSGFSHRAGDYVRYTCDYYVSGSSAEWSCHDSNGARWRGSR